MKNFARASAILICGAALLAGCSTTPTTIPVAPTSPDAASVAAAGANASGSTQPAPESTIKTGALRPHLDPASAISRDRSVYFDFDSYTVKPEHLKMLDMHGKYLAATPGLAIRIEGHTDERGGAEYNLALGQRRAESVLRAMRVNGVKDAQMEAVSWGQAKPRAPGRDEASLAQNRRVDLVYPAR